jgi:hypothetical protein
MIDFQSARFVQTWLLPFNVTMPLRKLLVCGIQLGIGGGKVLAGAFVQRRLVGSVLAVGAGRPYRRWAEKTSGGAHQDGDGLIPGSRHAETMPPASLRQPAGDPDQNRERLLSHPNPRHQSLIGATTPLERVVSGGTKANDLHALLPWNWAAAKTNQATDPIAA